MEIGNKLTNRPWFLLICTWLAYLAVYPFLLFLIENIESDLDFIPIILLPIIIVFLFYLLCKFTTGAIWRANKPKLSILIIAIALIAQIYIGFVYFVFAAIYMYSLIGGPIRP